MYTCNVWEAFGPFCGVGGYGTNRATAMSRSPKKAVETAKRLLARQPEAGGGVPILAGFQLLHGTKILVDKID